MPGEPGPVGSPGPPGNDLNVYSEINDDESIHNWKRKIFPEIRTVEANK